MRLAFLILGLCLVTVVLTAQTLEQTMLVDFGPDDVENGNATASPDPNGHYWNNSVDPSITAPPVVLIDDKNNGTGYVLTMTYAMSSYGIANGGLLVPDAALLGELAIPTATQDYYFTFGDGAFTLANLDTSYSYRFTMFGSRNSASTRITEYRFFGENTEVGELQTSGISLGVGTSSPHGNDSHVYTSAHIHPTEAGQILVEIGVVEGYYGYLNLLKIEAFSTLDPTVSTDDRVDSAVGHFRLFPNPVDNVLYIESTTNGASYGEAIQSISIYDSSGTIVKVVDGATMIDVSQLYSGLYFVRMVSESGKMTSCRLLKN